MKKVWQRFYAEDGPLVYEGFAVTDKAYGPGTEYYADGTPFHEGDIRDQGTAHRQGVLSQRRRAL